MMDKRYFVDFYDMIDGWIGRGSHDPEWQFDDLNKAKAFADKKQDELDQGNKDAGEHYGVIDAETRHEVHCTKS